MSGSGVDVTRNSHRPRGQMLHEPASPATGSRLRQPESTVDRGSPGQAGKVVMNMGTGLTPAGAKFSDVVKMNSYITDMSKVQAVRDVRAIYFKDATPASTFVEVKGLVRPELLLEIEVIAAIPAR